MDERETILKKLNGIIDSLDANKIDKITSFYMNGEEAITILLENGTLINIQINENVDEEEIENIFK